MKKHKGWIRQAFDEQNLVFTVVTPVKIYVSSDDILKQKETLEIIKDNTISNEEKINKLKDIAVSIARDKMHSNEVTIVPELVTKEDLSSELDWDKLLNFFE